MDHKNLYVLSEEDMKKAMQEVIEGEIEEKIFNRFLNIKIDSKGACQILEISQSTLQRYVKSGQLVPEVRESGSQSFKFRLSYLLKINMEELKRKKRYSL